MAKIKSGTHLPAEASAQAGITQIKQINAEKAKESGKKHKHKAAAFFPKLRSLGRRLKMSEPGL